MIVKIFNIILVIVLVAGLFFLSQNYTRYEKQGRLTSSILSDGPSYNTFSIKQIDSLTAAMNLRFSFAMLKEDKPY